MPVPLPKVLVGSTQSPLAWWPFRWVSSRALSERELFHLQYYTHTPLLLRTKRVVYTRDKVVVQRCVFWQLPFPHAVIRFSFDPVHSWQKGAGWYPYPHLGTWDGDSRKVFAPSRNHVECGHVNNLLSHIAWCYTVKHNSTKRGFCSPNSWLQSFFNV